MKKMTLAAPSYQQVNSVPDHTSIVNMILAGDYRFCDLSETCGKSLARLLHTTTF